MNFVLFLFVLFGLAWYVARYRPQASMVALLCAGLLFLLTVFDVFNLFWAVVFWSLYAFSVLFYQAKDLRQQYLSRPLMSYVRSILPPMSETERDAIEAGNTWWESELFQGAPDWNLLRNYRLTELSEEEQAFIDGPVEELCRMIDDWDITHRRLDLPPEVWAFLKREKFFGMIIPRRYGGLEFSHLAHSSVVTKISARSISAGVTVMVPNSLGPAELLLHYGTDEQRDHYLPRLADGREIPCFALTGPSAGSDAGAIPDSGVVCHGTYGGKKVLGLRLNWEKRYITMGPIATVLGLAFKAYDPDQLLGEQTDLGITCALIPVDTPGVSIGNRHFPMNAAFQNGPNSGKDVFVPLSFVIGGEANIGKGWRMLVESLSVGRGISLPAVGVAAGKSAAYTTGAYARIRKQFNTSIGKFEGVEEALARIGGLTYLMDSARLLTLAGLDQGEKPSVVTAILKQYNTEMMRQAVNDAMDVHGGRGICMGPSNYLARAYQTVPIGITVEGANILTRTMIIFGQGAMRCHPYLVQEMQSATRADQYQGLQQFDQALLGHIGYFSSNLCAALIYGLSASHLAPRPYPGRIGQYYQRLAQMSAAFAVTADLVLMLMGGAFKRKEKMSGRFADALAYMFYASAALRKFEHDGQPRIDLPLVEWSAKYCLYQVQMALDEILRNFPIKWLGVLIRLIIFPLGLSLRKPNDHLSHRVAALMIKPGAARDRLTAGIYRTNDPADITGCLEDALHKVMFAEPIERRLRHDGLSLPERTAYADWITALLKQGQVTEQEAEILLAAQLATEKVIAVDDFTPAELLNSQQAESATVEIKSATSQRKSPLKKAPAKKAAVKKAARKKGPAKKAVKKTVSKKATAKKASLKKAAASQKSENAAEKEDTE